MGNINTVIFDMDGTVLDTLEDLTLAVNTVLKAHGMPERTREEYRRFFGNGIAHALQLAVPAGTDGQRMNEMIGAFKTYYDAHCLDHTRPYEGITEMMEALDRQGYRMAIVSNKLDSAVQELNARFFAQHIRIAVGEKPGVRRKPAGDMLETALKALGSRREEAVYIGDSEVDLLTAENAGIPCISVLWGFRDREELAGKGARLFAEKPEDVIRLLQAGPGTGEERMHG